MAAGEALAVCVELNLTQDTPRKDMEAVRAWVSDLAIEAAGKGADKTLFLEPAAEPGWCWGLQPHLLAGSPWSFLHYHLIFHANNSV